VSSRATLKEIGKRLQQAVAARLFAKADTLVREYQRCLEALPASAQDRADVLQEAAALFENVRRMTLAARAAAAAQLTALPAITATQYCTSERPAQHTWEMRG